MADDPAQGVLDIFEILVEEGLRCMADGADVICLGSTAMREAHPHLTGASVHRSVLLGHT